MITIEIDKNTCRCGGICTEVCPIGILKMNDESRVPEFVPGGGERCINCGHCFSACPSGSLTLSTMCVAAAPRIDPARMPDAGEVELFLKARRSVRKYKDEPLARETVEKILDIARYAPSGINRQPVNWAVVMGPEKVQELAALVVRWMEGLVAAQSPLVPALRLDASVAAWQRGEDRICRRAPCVIVAYGLKDDPMVPQACTIAATYLELAAAGHRLGACWAGYVNMAINSSEEVRKFVGISARASAGAVMMLGHPKYRYARLPYRNAARVSWK